MDPDRPFHHRVLPLQNDGVSAQPLVDVLELLGADVVRGDNEDLAILVEEGAELGIVGDLLVGLVGFSTVRGTFGNLILSMLSSLIQPV
ncbi:hypothetical protein FF1_028057 [Malus domestica]